MLKKLISIVLILGLICVSRQVQANGNGTTAFNFLKIGTGARAFGMGEAMTALSEDANSIYWNPAGIAEATANKQICATYIQWLQGISYQNASALYHTGKQSLGISLTQVSFDSQEKRDIHGSLAGEFTPADTNIGFAYGLTIAPAISAGIVLKQTSENIAGDKISATSFDLGMNYHVTNKITLALVSQNIGQKVLEYSLPLTNKIGLGIKLKMVNVGVDVIQAKGESISFKTGIEIKPIELLAVRVGYKSRHYWGEGLTFGIGLQVAKIAMDIGIARFGELGDIYNYSLQFKF